MSIINKSLAIPMFPLGILILVESLGLFHVSFIIDKILIGAFLMIALQISSLLHAKKHNGVIGIVHWGLAFIFMVPASLYFFTPFFKTVLPIIISIGMVIESFYALF